MNSINTSDFAGPTACLLYAFVNASTSNSKFSMVSGVYPSFLSLVLIFENHDLIISSQAFREMIIFDFLASFSCC
jgi:hypothetical protein